MLEFTIQDEEIPEETKRRTADYTTTHICRWLLGIFLFIIALFAILVTELLWAPIRERWLDSATVDVSQPLPHATFHVQFQHGSRLSTVAIQSLHCDLEESGAVEFEVVHNDSSSSYTIQETCPEEVVQAHVDLFWKILTESLTNGNQESTGTGGGVGDFKCLVGIRISLGKLIAYSHSVTIDNAWGAKFKPSPSASADKK